MTTYVSATIRFGFELPGDAETVAEYVRGMSAEELLALGDRIVVSVTVGRVSE